MNGDRVMPRILLVEDNEMNRDMLSRRLRRRGYDVLEAENGDTALEMARGQPDVILMDIGLPGRDGWEVAAALKADPATAELPVIALTAHALASDREKSIVLGFADFDTKPVDFARLVCKIELQLDRRA